MRLRPGLKPQKGMEIRPFRSPRRRWNELAEEPVPQTYEGGCHCGRVRFRVTADLSGITYCNCSICAKKGFLHLIVPPENFELISGKDALTTYRFNTGAAQHTFCATCGIHPFYVPRSTRQDRHQRTLPRRRRYRGARCQAVRRPELGARHGGAGAVEIAYVRLLRRHWFHRHRLSPRAAALEIGR